MIERDDSARLALETAHPPGVAGEARGEQLERGFAARDQVGREIDLTHPARADALRNFVMTDPLPGGTAG